jgi:hypothetical protein
LPAESATSATSGLPNAVPTVADWPPPEATETVAGLPATTLKLRVFEVVGVLLMVALAARVMVPAPAPVIVLVATPAEALAAPVPVTVPLPAVCEKVIVAELSDPLVTVLPAASSTVAVNVRVVPLERLPVAPESTIWAAAPEATEAARPVLVADQDCQTAVTVYV